MSQNWKKQVEEERERQRQQQLKNELARKREEEAQWELKAKVEFIKFQRKYRCHVCGKPSEEMETGEYVMDECGSVFEDYDEPLPGDLKRCKRCDRWSCYDCLYDGICKRCWGK